MVNYDTSRYDPKGNKNLMAIDSADEEIKNLYLEGAAHALRVAGFVWDSESLSWVRAQQPATATDLSLIEQATSDIRWKDYRFSYNGNDIQYIGLNDVMNALDTDTNWWIMNLTFSNGNVTRIQIANGSWSTRESLF